MPLLDLHARLARLADHILDRQHGGQPLTVEVIPSGSCGMPETRDLPSGVHEHGDGLLYVYPGPEPDPAVVRVLARKYPCAVVVTIPRAGA